jgi:hypothetical protein
MQLPCFRKVEDYSSGLPAVELFLRYELQLNINSPSHVWLWTQPQPWPATLRWEGHSVCRNTETGLMYHPAFNGSAKPKAGSGEQPAVVYMYEVLYRIYLHLLTSNIAEIFSICGVHDDHYVCTYPKCGNIEDPIQIVPAIGC